MGKIRFARTYNRINLDSPTKSVQLIPKVSPSTRKRKFSRTSGLQFRGHLNVHAIGCHLHPFLMHEPHLGGFPHHLKKVKTVTTLFEYTKKSC